MQCTHCKLKINSSYFIVLIFRVYVRIKIFPILFHIHIPCSLHFNNKILLFFFYFTIYSTTQHHSSQYLHNYHTCVYGIQGEDHCIFASSMFYVLQNPFFIVVVVVVIIFIRYTHTPM